MKSHSTVYATLLICASMALVMGNANAQQSAGALPTAAEGQTTKGVELKGKVPVNQSTLKTTLPKPVEATLSNGIQVVLIEDHKLPTFVVQIVMPYGSIADPKGREGLASATAQQLREGTTSRSNREIAIGLDTLGGSMSGSASYTNTTVLLSGLIENIDPMLDIFADVVRHPVFPSGELEKYKARLISQIEYQRSSPNFLVQERFASAVYGDFPAGRPVPPEASIKALTSDDLMAFHATHFCPNCATILAAGDIDIKQLLPKLQRVFGDWQKADAPASALPPVAPIDESHVYVIDRKGSVQTSLVLGSLGITGNSPDRHAVAVMNQILGGGPASRLFINLREDKGYTYGAYSSASSYLFPGTVIARAEVRTEVTEGAMREFAYELDRIRTQPPSDIELANAKRALIGSFALSLENPQSFLSNVYARKIYDFPTDYWDHYPQYLSAITTQDVERVAAKYFDPAHLQIVAVGDGDKIRPVLQKYGKVQE
jgi:zinc protease